MKPVKQILLLNVHSLANAGDAVLNEVAVAQLQKVFPAAAITLAMNDPASHDGATTQAVASFNYWLKELPRRNKITGWLSLIWLVVHSLICLIFPGLISRQWPWSPLLQVYRQADLCVSCPGNFLYSSGRVGLPFLMTIFTLAYALWSGRPLYMMPQTIGPLVRGWERSLTRWLLRRVRRVVVRDAVSAELVRELGFGLDEVDVVPDVAFGFAAADTALGTALLQECGVDLSHRPILGVTLINWGAQTHRFTRQTEYENAVVQAIQAFIQTTDGQVILFSQVHGPTPADDDRLPAQRVFAALPHLHNHLTFISRPVLPHQLKSAYSLTDLFLGSRLHSTIFALSEQRPVVAIQYQYKTRGVFQLLGLEDWVVDINNVTPENLIPLLHRAWRQRETIQDHLNHTLPTLATQVEAVTAHMAQDWQKTYA